MFLLGSFVDSWKGALNGVKCNQIPFIGEQFAATMTVKENPAPVDMAKYSIMYKVLAPSQVVVWNFWTLSSRFSKPTS